MLRVHCSTVAGSKYVGLDPDNGFQYFMSSLANMSVLLRFCQGTGSGLGLTLLLRTSAEPAGIDQLNDLDPTCLQLKSPLNPNPTS